MREKIFMNILAANAIFGMLLCGAEAPTMATQIFVSTFGFFLFAGASWGIIALVRKKEACNGRNK